MFADVEFTFYSTETLLFISLIVLLSSATTYFLIGADYDKFAIDEAIPAPPLAIKLYPPATIL